MGCYNWYQSRSIHFGPCRGSLKFNPSSTDPLESGLFTLKSSRTESDQLSVACDRQGITVENQIGPRRSGGKKEVEAQTWTEVWWKTVESGCWRYSSRRHKKKWRQRGRVEVGIVRGELPVGRSKSGDARSECTQLMVACLRMRRNMGMDNPV